MVGLWLVSFTVVFAQKQKADSLYEVKNYADAAKIYETDLKHAPSVEEYNNLGNAYYRQNNLPRAILNYQRALRLAPADLDIRHSLNVCQVKLQDQFNASSEMFFIMWIQRLRSSLSPDSWAAFGLIFIVMATVFLGFYRFADKIWQQRVGLSLFIVFLFSLIVSFIFAFQQRSTFINQREAVIMKDSSLFDSAVTSARRLRVLHEGSIVEVSSDSGAWLQVILPDGTIGWITKSSVEFV